MSMDTCADAEQNVNSGIIKEFRNQAWYYTASYKRKHWFDIVHFGLGCNQVDNIVVKCIVKFTIRWLCQIDITSGKTGKFGNNL